MLGDYSDLSKERKAEILRYSGYKVNNNGEISGKLEDVKGKVHYYTILNPEESKELIAKEMVEVHKMFDTEKEALNILKLMKEICEPYNKDKETFKKNII